MESTKLELLAKYCQGERNNQLANEVLRAYEHEIKGVVRPVANGLCPERCDREDFFCATLNRTLLKFIRGVCSYRGAVAYSWKAWLRQVACSAALEELDFLIHRRWNIPIVEVGPDQIYPMNSEDGSEDKGGTWDRLYRSSHHQGVMAQKQPPADALMEAEERKSITLTLLVLHTQQSEEDGDSGNAIRLRYWDDWSVVRIAEYRFGEPITAGKEQAIRRELKDNYKRLQVLLNQEFGIKSLSQI